MESLSGAAAFQGWTDQPANQQTTDQPTMAAHSLSDSISVCGGARGTVTRAGADSATASSSGGMMPRATATAAPTMFRIWLSMNESPLTDRRRQEMPPARCAVVGGGEEVRGGVEEVR
jgi:hypothetical protein